MINTYEELNEVQLDVLKEIGNIGAGNAATALATMLNERVDIAVPRVRITDFDTAVRALGGAEQMTVGVLVEFSGEAKGIIMFLLKMEDANRIMSILVGEEEEEEAGRLSEMKLSAIKEIGNILSASYMNSISMLTGLAIQVSLPTVAIDMAGALMSVPIIQFGEVGDKVMFIEESFMTEGNDLRSNVIMFAEIETVEEIMKRLGLEV